jgi:hypothetical protein
MKECEFIGPEEAEQKMDEIIRLGEIEVQIKAYLWDRSKGVQGHLDLDLDEVKTIVKAAIITRVDSNSVQLEIGTAMEKFILFHDLGISPGPHFKVREAAGVLLDWVSTIKAKVAQ